MTPNPNQPYGGTPTNIPYPPGTNLDSPLQTDDATGPGPTLNPVTQGVNFPNLWSVLHQTTGPYQSCLICSKMITDMGIMPVPSAGAPGTPPAFIQLHAPFQLRLVAFELDKWGAAPPVPDPDTGNPNEVLIYQEIDASGPIVSNMANAWQRIAGFYVYFIATPSDVTEDGAPGVKNLASVIPASVAGIQQVQFIQGAGAIAPLKQNPTVPIPAIPGRTVQQYNAAAPNQG